jgi:triosephosphate isomerase
MRKKIVAGNWKMNLELQSAVQLATEVKNALNTSTDCEVILFPSLVNIHQVCNAVEDSVVKVGGQNCARWEHGAYTGEVSAGQLTSVGARYVIIGHSERREIFGETNEDIKHKLQIALKNGLTPVFCCGEPLSIRQHNTQQDYVYNQLTESLFTLSAQHVADIIIAYEPVWAIGTGLNATPEQAQEMHQFIRARLADKYGPQIAAGIRILYGGSCKPDNAQQLFACADVDGGLIGGASLKAKDFLAIIAAAQ